MSASLSDFGIYEVLTNVADHLTESANRAALGLRATMEAAGIAGVAEVSTLLLSVVVRFDLRHRGRAVLWAKLHHLARQRDWLGGLPASDAHIRHANR